MTADAGRPSRVGRFGCSRKGRRSQLDFIEDTPTDTRSAEVRRTCPNRPRGRLTGWHRQLALAVAMTPGLRTCKDTDVRFGLTLASLRVSTGCPARLTALSAVGSGSLKLSEFVGAGTGPVKDASPVASDRADLLLRCAPTGDHRCRCLRTAVAEPAGKGSIIDLR